MNDEILSKHIQDDDDFKEEMRNWRKTVATKDDITGAVAKSMDDYFKSKGKLTFSIIIGTSIIVTALVALFGGVKTLLAWIGFSYLGR